MAWVETRVHTRIDAAGKRRQESVYLARYRDASGKGRSAGTFKRKREASEAAQRQERLVKRGDWTDPDFGKITVGSWAEEWLSSLNVGPKTRHTYEERWNSLIRPTWADVRLDRVTLSTVKAWVSTMVAASGKAAGDTRRHDAAAQLVRMLDAAVDEGRILRNPARTKAGKLDYLPRVKRSKAHRYLTDAELQAVAEQCGDYSTFVQLAGYTGLRWGEITALRVGDFNLLTGRLSVERAFSTVGSQLILGEPKTHERRQVVVPGFLREGLAQLMVGKSRQDLVFVSATGHPLNNRNWPQRVLEPAWQAACIERLTFHDLRHTAASLAVAAGANVKGVQRMLGHASASMTLDVYSGLFDGHLDDVAERMSERALEARSGRSAHSVPTAVPVTTLQWAVQQTADAV